MANIALIPQVDEEEDYGQDGGQRQGSSRTLARERSGQSLPREPSKRSIKEGKAFGMQQPAQKVSYVVTHQPVDERVDDRSASTSQNPVSGRQLRAPRPSDSKIYIRKDFARAGGSPGEAEINRLKAHIRPNKQTRAVNSHQQPPPKGADFASANTSP